MIHNSPLMALSPRKQQVMKARKALNLSDNIPSQEVVSKSSVMPLFFSPDKENNSVFGYSEQFLSETMLSAMAQESSPDI